MVLRFIEECIQDGTILIFDELFCYCGNSNKGKYRVLRELLEKNPTIKVSEYQKFENNKLLLNVLLWAIIGLFTFMNIYLFALLGHRYGDPTLTCSLVFDIR